MIKTLLEIFNSDLENEPNIIEEIMKNENPVFEIEVLRSELDAGEMWENKSKRTIKICQSSDNRGMKPSVYFGISVKTKNDGGTILEDFFLKPEAARKIAKELKKAADTIDKNWGK